MSNRFYMLCTRETVGSNASFHCHNGNGYNSLDAAAGRTAGAKTMTEGMRQHRAFVLTCLLAIAKRRTAQEVKGE
ncbi:hypothetical protein QPE40_28205 [Klebsiella pneumoniae]